MNDVDRELARLTEATDGLRPSDGLTDAVMAAIDAEPPRGWPVEVERSGRVALVLAAAAAAVGIWWSGQIQQSVDAEVMASVDLVEISE